MGFCSRFSVRQAAAQATCPNSGLLDTLNSDATNDLTADAPPANRQHDSSTIIFAHTPVEDPAVCANIFKPPMDYMGTRTGKHWVYCSVRSSSTKIEAMRSGQLHLAGTKAPCAGV